MSGAAGGRSVGVPDDELGGPASDASRSDRGPLTVSSGMRLCRHLQARDRCRLLAGGLREGFPRAPPLGGLLLHEGARACSSRPSALRACPRRGCLRLADGATAGPGDEGGLSRSLWKAWSTRSFEFFVERTRVSSSRSSNVDCGSSDRLGFVFSTWKSATGGHPPGEPPARSGARRPAPRRSREAWALRSRPASGLLQSSARPGSARPAWCDAGACAAWARPCSARSHAPPSPGAAAPRRRSAVASARGPAERTRSWPW